MKFDGAVARLGYVPQKIAADRQLPFQLRDLLKAKAIFLKLPGAELEQVSSEVGLTRELLNTSIGHLSGGQFQKALIAFALLDNQMCSSSTSRPQA